MASRNIIIPSNNGIRTSSRVFGMPSTPQEWQSHATMLQKIHKIRGIGYWQMSLATRDIFWSEMVYDFFGVDPEQFIPQQEDVISLVHPHDRKKSPKRYKSSRKRASLISNIESSSQTVAIVGYMRLPIIQILTTQTSLSALCRTSQSTKLWNTT